MLTVKDTPFTAILPIVGKKSSWARSRVGVRADKSTIPILHYLAEQAFHEPVDHINYSYYWKDKDALNETAENVVRVPRVSSTPKRSAYGVPAGTPEYFRKYQARNKEKMHAAQARWRAKRKQEIAAAAKDLDEANAFAEIERLLAPPPGE